MGLEFLLGSEMNKPIHLFFIGIVFSSIAVFLSSSLFSHSPSMVVIAFMTIPCIYVFTNYLNKKSEEETKECSIKNVFMINVDLAEMYLFLFLGMSVGITLWFSILPFEMLKNVFSEQIWNLEQLGVATGFAINPETFMLIASNNVKLVLLCTIMSFIFGAGSLFILSWNASVVGVAVGTLISKMRMAGTAASMAALRGLSLGTAYYILHLVPEVVAYFYAAVAGAFISSAFIRYKPFSKECKKLLGISLLLLFISVALIIFGAYVEIQVSYAIQSMYG
ncbi:MAG: hypothetical protein ISS95_01445 [Candidatus Aenigmarchaeota archaeon]|nr:hypothetical protein [Candidatus Aenigmarchaeota archaeon]